MQVWCRLAWVAAAVGAATACALGGQEGEDYRPGSTGSVMSGTTGTDFGGTGTGTGGTTGTSSGGEPGDDDPGATHTDTGDTGDTGWTGAACPDRARTLYLSPDDSNSYASAVLLRERPGAFSPRIYELFNAYDFDVPAGPAGSVAITAEWLEDGVGPEQAALQVHLGAEHREARDPLNLTLVLDTSCSMGGAGLARLKDACAAIADRLDAGDTVSVVTWSSQDNTVLAGHPVSGPSDPTLVSACLSLTASGGTDLHNGLMAGYALTEANWLPGMVNRVVLVSDGGANLGVTDADLIARKAQIADQHRIFLVGIGVGDPGSYNDGLMDAVTDAGRGASLFLATEQDAWALLYDRFTEVFDVALTDVRLELDLPAWLAYGRASAEEVAADPSSVRPQYLAPDAEMVFYGEVAAGDPACLSDDVAITARATFVDPAGSPQVVERTFRLGDLRAATPRNALKGRAIFLVGTAARTGDPGDVDLARAALDAADLAWPGDADLAELRGILDAL